MTNCNLIAALSGMQKNSGRTYGTKTSTRGGNVTTSYLQVLQNTLFKSSTGRNNFQTATSANRNNSYVNNSANYGNPYVSDPHNNILMGDANDDGVVDKNDLELLQCNLIGLGKVKNFRAADMDGDGEITVTDVSKLNLLLREQKNSVSKIKGDVNGDGKVDVVGDAVTITNYVNGYITKNDFLYDNADVYQDGKVDINDAKKIQAYVNGEISSLDDDTWSPDSTPQPYQAWSAKATAYKVAFTDENLTQRNGNEAVYAGDKITVLDERENSYLVRYPTSKGTKDRWVSKANIEPYQDPIIPDPLKNLINQWEGKIWKDETTGKGNYQCKDFAAYIFRQMYDVWYIGSTQSKSSGNNYKININNPSRVGTRDEIKNLTASKAQSLFANAQAGDFVQMRRSGTGGSHSAIVGEVTDKGVWFFEANAPDSNGGGYVYNKIKYQFHSWENLAQKNSAMSVYYAK